jgi:hypothetical protein
MQSMNITTSERTIKRSLLLAAKIAQDRLFIKKEAERLKAVINVSEEGILFVNIKDKLKRLILRQKEFSELKSTW